LSALAAADVPYVAEAAAVVGAGLAGWGVGSVVHEGIDVVAAICVHDPGGPWGPRDPGYVQPPQVPRVPSDAGVLPGGIGDGPVPAVDPPDAGVPSSTRPILTPEPLVPASDAGVSPGIVPGGTRVLPGSTSDVSIPVDPADASAP